MSSPEQDFLEDMPHFPDPELEAKRELIYAPLGERDIARLARFGERRTFHDGEHLFEISKPSAGMYVVLSGTVAAFRRDPLGRKCGSRSAARDTSSPSWVICGGIGLHSKALPRGRSRRSS